MIKKQVLRRSSRIKRSADRILIVCEGKKTEPLYLKAMKNHYKITSLDTRTGDRPQLTALLAFAKKHDQQSQKEGNPYTRIYLVYDHDNQKNLKHTEQQIEEKGYIKIRSIPCFEYWLILHFEYTRQPFSTPCACKQKWKEVSKKENLNADQFSGLMSCINKAIENAERADKDAEQSQQPNPTTDMPILVGALKPA